LHATKEGDMSNATESRIENGRIQPVPLLQLQAVSKKCWPGKSRCPEAILRDERLQL